MIGFQALALAFLSVIFMYADHRFPAFHRFRAHLSVVVLPAQAIVDSPIKLAHGVGGYMIAQKKLVSQNEQLRAHALVLESKLQQLLLLEKENTNLRMLLQSSAQLDGRTMVAELVALGVDPNQKELILDKGSQQGVYVGQPVLDSSGIVGQVIDVNAFASRVLLISDTRSAVPVQNYRNGFRSIVEGLGSGDLTLLHVPDTSDVEKGDLFVSSGLGLRYPAGYPVGRVLSVVRDNRSRFLIVILQPAAHLNQAREVLLMWPSAQSIKRSVQGLLNKNVLAENKAI